MVATVALWGASSALADGEYEPNDSLTQTAGPLAAGVAYEATQDTDNDVDWYRFYTSGQVQLTVTATVLNDGGCNISLRDHKGDEMNNVGFSDGKFYDLKQTLYRPGIYYLVVVCKYDTGARYRLTLSPANATVSEACGLAQNSRTDAQKDVEKATEKVAKAKARKQDARGKRAKQKAKARLRQARGLLANASAILTGWQAAVTANC